LLSLFLPHAPSSPLFPYTTLFRSLSDQEVREQLEGFAAEAGVEKTEFSDGALDVMRVSLVAGQLLNGPDAERATIEVTELLEDRDRKSTRLNSSHVSISYAVFCLK